MITRPRSVSITAILFALGAALFTAGTVVQGVYFLLSPRYFPSKLLVAFSMGTVCWLVTIALWRLMEWGRRTGIGLMLLGMLYVGAILFRLSKLRSEGSILVQWGIFIEASFFALSPFWLPIYLLTRSHVRAVFR